MIEIRKLRELVRLMVENDLSEVDLRDGEEHVTLRRPGPAAPPVVTTAPAAPAPADASNHRAPASPPSPAPGTSASDAREKPAEENLTRIESPMVGTFYASPNPNSPPFVKVGASVDPDTVVCLVEAMKIFNEIKAETRGTVEKVLVQNGQSVEFGQPLFLVRPD